MASEASPHWEVERETLYCHAWPNRVLLARMLALSEEVDGKLCITVHAGI